MKRLSVATSRRRLTRNNNYFLIIQLQNITVVLPVERDENAALFIEVSPEIGKEVFQLRQSLHIAVFNGIANDWNLNDVGVEVNPVVLFKVSFDEYRRL